MGSVPLAALLGGFLADIAGITVPLILWPTILGIATITFFIATKKHQARTKSSAAGLYPKQMENPRD